MNWRRGLEEVRFLFPFVSEAEIKRAVLLIRDLRLKALQQDLNPMAIRIALKFALYVDDLMAKQKLSPGIETHLEAVARALVDSSRHGGIPGWF